ncbi:Thioredoxin-like protein AAED1, chloroplastic [Linum perenne]
MALASPPVKFIQSSLLMTQMPISHHPQLLSYPIPIRKPAGPLNRFCIASRRGVHTLSSVTRQASSSGDFSPTIGELLSEVSVFKATGEGVVLKDLWDQNEGMAVVALLRHFGCPCCWELASELKAAKSKMESAGVKLIAIGVGEPKKALLFAERLPFPVDCLYADPGRKAYDVLGLYYGFGRTFLNPASAKVLSRFDSLRKAVQNYTIEATPDDRSGVLQQGGMFVFKGKELVYARKDEGTGDHAPLNDIIDICCQVPVS